MKEMWLVIKKKMGEIEWFNIVGSYIIIKFVQFLIFGVLYYVMSR